MSEKQFAEMMALSCAGATAGVPIGAALHYFNLSDLWAMVPLTIAALYFLSRLTCEGKRP
jgi:hypothetical protein